MANLPPPNGVDPYAPPPDPSLWSTYDQDKARALANGSVSSEQEWNGLMNLMGMRNGWNMNNTPKLAPGGVGVMQGNVPPRAPAPPVGGLNVVQGPRPPAAQVTYLNGPPATQPPPNPVQALAQSGPSQPPPTQAPPQQAPQARSRGQRNAFGYTSLAGLKRLV